MTLENWSKLENRVADLLGDDPSNVSLLIIAAIVQARLGNFPILEKMLAGLQNVRLTTPEEIYYLAELKAALGESEEALTLYGRASEGGYASAQGKYGIVLLSSGQTTQGLDWVKKAAKSGSNESKLTLAYFYVYAPDPEYRDTFKAETLMRELMNAKYVPALRAFGLLRLEGQHEDGLEYLRQSADAGDAMSQLIMAKVLLQTNVPGDDASKYGFRYARLAYEAGYKEATATLANYYLMGRGVKPDIKKAITLLDDGVEHGDGECIKMEGNLLMSGDIVEQNYKGALPLFDHCANALGDHECMFFLAQMHLHGLGTAKNVELGKKLLQESAAMGNSRAKDTMDRRLYDLLPEEWITLNQDEDQ
jgi:TPR repeat protein